MPENSGQKFDESILKNCPNWLNEKEIEAVAQKYAEDVSKLPPDVRKSWLIKAIEMMDLTTLSGDDFPGKVTQLCERALKPIDDELVQKLGLKNLQTAAICVYPLRVPDANVAVAPHIQPNIASVAGGFPSGQYRIETRVDEVKYAVADGANEIDIVINRSAALTGDWKMVYDEVLAMKTACQQKAHVKTILAVGELKTLENIWKASHVAMMAGSDFIKTSTGKESVNATLPFSIVMCRAIKEYYGKTGIKVGFKPAGGIRTSNDALAYMILIEKELGDDWLKPELFRFGASTLLDDIAKTLKDSV